MKKLDFFLLCLRVFYSWTYKPYHGLLNEKNNSSISLTLHSTEDTTNHNIFGCLHIVMASCPQMMFRLTLNQLKYIYLLILLFFIVRLGCSTTPLPSHGSPEIYFRKVGTGKKREKISQPLLFRVGAVRACSIAKTTFVIRPLTGICYQHIVLSIVDLYFLSAT